MCDTLVGKISPDFTAEAVMPDGSFQTINLSSFKGKKYVVLLFYPLDFTFVCPSEILAFNHELQKFEAFGAQILGVSVDSKFCHGAWRDTPIKSGGVGHVGFPLISDLDKSISKKYRVLCDDGIALRGLFILDKSLIIQHATINNLAIGRSVDETIRILNAIKYIEENGEVCPANWNKGKSGMKPTKIGVIEYLNENF